MVYSEVPNFSEPNPELLAQANQQNKSVSGLIVITILIYFKQNKKIKTIFMDVLNVNKIFCLKLIGNIVFLSTDDTFFFTN